MRKFWSCSLGVAVCVAGCAAPRAPAWGAVHQPPLAAASDLPIGSLHPYQEEHSDCALCGLYDEVRRYTFLVRAGDSIGAAVLIAEARLIVTNAHVVGDLDEVELVDSDGERFAAAVIARSERQDLAAITIPPPLQSRSGLAVGERPPRVGSEVFAIGHPLGLGWTVSRGIVSGLPVVDGSSMVQTDASISPGNSGGPLVDRGGRLVGIVTSKVSGGGAENIAFARPVQSVRAFLAGAEIP